MRLSRIITRKGLISVLVLIVGGTIGTLFFLVKSNSHQHEGRETSTSNSQQAGAPSGLTQKEIEDLLDFNGEAFIEIARFKGNYKSDEYWQYDNKLQELVSELENYNRFILESEFRKNVVDPHSYERNSHDQYYRLLVGPFGKEELAEELNQLTGLGYKDASIQQMMKSDELYPPEENRLLFLYIKNKGPRFISGLLHYWLGYMEYVIDSDAKRLLFHSFHTNHGDRNGGRLFLADGNTGIISNLSDHSQGFILLPETGKALVQKTFSIKTDEPLDYFKGMRSSVSLMHKLDKADLDRVAKEIGVDANQVQIQVVGDKPAAIVSALFELDLRTGALKSLKLFGGFGGIFMLKDGSIYLSNSYTTSFYRDLVDMEETLGVFGHRPYQLLDLKSRRLINMPDDFQPDSSDVIQPGIGRQSEVFSIIAEAGVVKLISFKNRFFLQH